MFLRFMVHEYGAFMHTILFRRYDFCMLLECIVFLLDGNLKLCIGINV